MRRRAVVSPVTSMSPRIRGGPMVVGPADCEPVCPWFVRSSCGEDVGWRATALPTISGVIKAGTNGSPTSHRGGSEARLLVRMIHAGNWGRVLWAHPRCGWNESLVSGDSCAVSRGDFGCVPLGGASSDENKGGDTGEVVRSPSPLSSRGSVAVRQAG